MWHTRDEVVERTIAEFERLDALLSGLTDAEWGLPVSRPDDKDPWTVRDTVAHVTHWKLNTARVIRKERRPPEERGLQMHDTNHLVYVRWRDVPGADVLAWHRQVQAGVVSALREAPDAFFTLREHNADWPYDLDGHSVQHRVKDIERALGRGAGRG